MSEVFTVFYCWQNDRKRQHNHDLIREALEAAADAISTDNRNPYQILIQSDTEGEPGLCNIPETILRRLRESDAVVSDLTFVARTENDDPKHCSNPNVLFELGYAFASLGPERLICVLNEAHGPAEKQIFDLAHHRRPIAFASPKEGTTRKETVASLAKDLESALCGVVQLGLVGGYGGDDEIRHQRQLSDIQTFSQSSGQSQARFPRIEFVFRPSLFRPKRWADAEGLERLLRRNAPRTDGYHSFPPLQTGTAAMDWGIYNDIYGDPWAMTYAGQFWAEFVVGGWESIELSERELRLSPERPENPFISAECWVSGERALRELSHAFRLAHNLSQHFGDGERVQLVVSARNIGGRWLRFEHSDMMGPCRAPTIYRDLEKTAAEFREAWLEDFAQIAKALCDLFCRDGRTVDIETIKSYASPQRFA